MKILIANKFYRPVGGPETIVLDTTRELNARGHETVPFAMAHIDNVEHSDYFVPNIDYNEQVRGRTAMIKEAVDIIYSREAARRIRKCVADTRPDVAHAHNIYHQLSPSILRALKKANVPTVLTLHDGKLLCANMVFLRQGRVCERCAGRKFYHAVINRCVKDSYAGSLVCCVEEYIHRWLRIYERNVDLFITPSQFLKRKLVEHGRLRKEQIEVLPNYACTDDFQPNYGPGDYGLFVGRLESLKGIMTLLKACTEIPDMDIRIAGRGPLMQEGKEFAEQENLSRVQFMGFRSGEELKQLFLNARFLVIPSECYENCPMVVLEAFSAGKPVIGSKIGGIPELIEHGTDGLLFEPGDAQALAEAMAALWKDPSTASEMGRQGRAKVEERFSIDKYMQSLIGIYSRMLNS